MNFTRLLIALPVAGFLVSCSSAPKGEPARGTQVPELVTSEEVNISGGFKTVIVGNERGRYTLNCVDNGPTSGCLTPVPGVRYMVFNKQTRYLRPGAKEPISLETIQDWTASYKDMENIGLFPERGGSPNEWGVYVLVGWKDHGRDQK